MITENDQKANGKVRVLQYHPRHQLVRFINQINEFFTYNPAEMVRSCISCDHFNESTELCGKVNQRPPAKIIAFACEMYENVDDEIPF